MVFVGYLYDGLGMIRVGVADWKDQLAVDLGPLLSWGVMSRLGRLGSEPNLEVVGFIGLARASRIGRDTQKASSACLLRALRSC